MWPHEHLCHEINVEQAVAIDTDDSLGRLYGSFHATKGRCNLRGMQDKMFNSIAI